MGILVNLCCLRTSLLEEAIRSRSGGWAGGWREGRLGSPSLPRPHTDPAALGPQCIPDAVLLEALALRNVRQLEDLVIEAVYADVLRGSLDQRHQRLEVDYSIGRDIQRQDLSAIARTLQEW